MIRYLLRIYIKVKFILNEIKEVVTETFTAWIDDNMMLHAAGLAFYTIFSLAPLLILVIAIAGFIFGEQATTGQLSLYMQDILGPELAATIENFVSSVSQRGSGVAATVIGTGVLVFAATTVITQLKDSLNTIWGIETPKSKGIAFFFINRMLGIALILIFSLILASTILVNYAVSIIGPYFSEIMPESLEVWSWMHQFFFLLITTILFGIIYKVLPDIKVKWADVLVGAFVTALLFMFGHYLVGIYLSNAATMSTFGAAGSFVIFLIWVYYNMMIIFLGAEFTQIYTNRYGSNVLPGVFLDWADRSMGKGKKDKKTTPVSEG